MAHVSVYLDHAASTALRPEARAAMERVWAGGPANPTGAHGPAQRARASLEAAREVVARHAGVAPGGVVLTSGGTEADNTAVGSGLAAGRVLYSAVEHPAVAVPAARGGGEVIPVDAGGVVDLDALERLLCGAPVAMVSVMAANNETGVRQPLSEVAAVVAERAPDAVLHSDAVQSFAKAPLDMAGSGVGMASVTAHKLGGPIGTGALLLGEAVDVTPLLWGGGQERERRAGTPDPAGAAAFAAALEAAAATDWEAVGRLRDRLESGLLAAIDGVTVHGAGALRLPTHCHVGVAGVAADLAVIACDRAGLAVSSGSSCASGALKASGVLAAMGAPGEGALRFSLGWTTTVADVERALDVVTDVVKRLR